MISGTGRRYVANSLMLHGVKNLVVEDWQSRIKFFQRFETCLKLNQSSMISIFPNIVAFSRRHLVIEKGDGALTSRVFLDLRRASSRIGRKSAPDLL